MTSVEREIEILKNEWGSPCPNGTHFFMEESETEIDDWETGVREYTLRDRANRAVYNVIIKDDVLMSASCAVWRGREQVVKPVTNPQEIAWLCFTYGAKP